ncbi:hypothetical protein C8Q80DRAFT_1260868 [Daedaleopsis nitida]|nr:hypothetical protein C8Q80DRAFT_1260868 [Daedaleopsis nitida]
MSSSDPASPLVPGIDDVLANARHILTLGRAVPLPGFAPLVGALVDIIDIIRDTRNNIRSLAYISRALSDLVEVVVEAQITLHSMVDAYADDEAAVDAMLLSCRSSGLTIKLETFLQRLLKLKDRANELYRGRSFFRYLYIDQDNRILDSLRQESDSALNVFKIDCMMAMNISIEEIAPKLSAMRKQMHNVAATIDQVKANQENQADEAILNTLPRVDAGFDAASNALKRRFQEGTRRSLVEDITSWMRTGIACQPICILSGAAGSGKSSVASEICKITRTRGELGASFYFTTGIQDHNSTKLVIPTLAFQLARSQAALRSQIVEGARQYLASGASQDINAQAHMLLEKPLGMENAQTSPVVIVLDGLDECTEHAAEDVPQLLRVLFAAARAVSFPLGIFITARPRRYIEDVLRSPEYKPLVHALSLDDLATTDSTRDDIAAFIKLQLSQLPSSHQLFNDHPDVVDRLAQHMEGSFPYARSLIDFVKGDPSHLHEQLGTFLREGPSPLVLRPLDELYQAALEHAYPSPRLEADKLQRTRVRQVLTYLAILRQPISPRTLEVLARVPTADSIPVLNDLRALVRYTRDEPDALFAPLHGTFARFLQRSDAGAGSVAPDVYRVDGKEEHARVVEGCLRTLFSLPQNICQLPARDLGRPRGEIFDMEDRVRRYVPPEVRYACVHWAAHLVEAGKTARNRKDVVLLLRRFAKEGVLPWVETLGYMGKLDLAADILDNTIPMVEVCRPHSWHSREQMMTYFTQSSLARRQLQDIRRLVLDCRAIIDVCPNRVYVEHASRAQGNRGAKVVE